MAEAPRGMRVLMTADTLGGVWDYSLELALQLSGRGVMTILASMGRLPSPAQRRAAAAVPGLVLQESAFPLEWMPDTVEEDLARCGDWLLGLARGYRPDLVHLNGYCHAPLPWPAPCLVVAHSCVLSWWRAVKGEPAPPCWDRYAERVSRGLRMADAVVAPTRALLEMMTALYGPLPHAEVIRNGRDPGCFRSGEKGRYVFTAGRLWDEAKNVTVLAAVGPDLAWPVIAAGDWRRPDGFGSRLEQVEYVGVLSSAELAGWLTRAPIFALPARYEPFGLTVLEAALSGCALVLGDIPTLRELWPGTALFVPPNDHDRWRTALHVLIRDDGLRVALGQAARELALTYTGERMADSYCRLYAEMQRRGQAQTRPGRDIRAPLAVES